MQNKWYRIRRKSDHQYLHIGGTTWTAESAWAWKGKTSQAKAMTKTLDVAHYFEDITVAVQNTVRSTKRGL